MLGASRLSAPHSHRPTSCEQPQKKTGKGAVLNESVMKTDHKTKRWIGAVIISSIMTQPAASGVSRGADVVPTTSLIKHTCYNSPVIQQQCCTEVLEYTYSALSNARQSKWRAILHASSLLSIQLPYPSPSSTLMYLLICRSYLRWTRTQSAQTVGWPAASTVWQLCFPWWLWFACLFPCQSSWSLQRDGTIGGERGEYRSGSYWLMVRRDERKLTGFL